MSKPRRLLVPVTQNSHSLHALDQALDLALSTKAGVTVLSVAPAYDGDLGLTSVGDVVHRLNEPAEKALSLSLAMAKEKGLRIEAILAQGETPLAIVEGASQVKADLIVMGIANHSPLTRFVKGNVPLRTIGHSSVDILLIPQKAQLAFGRLLFATDGSRHAEAAARTSVNLSKAYNAELIILHVVDMPFPQLAEIQLAAAQYQAHGQKALEAALALAREAGVQARGILKEGDAAATILATAKEEQVDCLVLASHGKSGLERLLMGSVAEGVVGLSALPVYMVVRKSN